MRQKNWRVVGTGILLALLGVGFYVVMSSMAGRSNDPKALMETVGTVAGVACAIGLAMIIFGLVGRNV